MTKEEKANLKPIGKVIYTIVSVLLAFGCVLVFPILFLFLSDGAAGFGIVVAVFFGVFMARFFISHFEIWVKRRFGQVVEKKEEKKEPEIKPRRTWYAQSDDDDDDDESYDKSDSDYDEGFIAGTLVGSVFADGD